MVKTQCRKHGYTAAKYHPDHSKWACLECCLVDAYIEYEIREVFAQLPLEPQIMLVEETVSAA